MAKKISFALEMADGTPVRNIEDLRDHFDIESAIKHFTSGKLLEWLEDRLYDEAEKIGQLDKDDPDFQRQLCEILGVEAQAYVNEKRDIDVIARANKKETILRQKTSDEQIIANAALTAFTQEDMAELLRAKEETIYLCGEELFNIPLRIENVKYIGILGTPKITIAAKSREELVEKKIVFQNVELPEELRETSERICPKCGEKVREKAKFCDYCGTPMDKAEEKKIKSCPKCGKENPASAKFCKDCGSLMDKVEEKDGSPSSGKVWKIPKNQLKMMFVATFKPDFQEYQYGPQIDENATFWMQLEKNRNASNDFSEEQKNIALSLICSGKYTEDDLIHLRISEDMSHGWALTRDSFCFVDHWTGISGIIPYDKLNLYGAAGTTQICLADNQWLRIHNMLGNGVTHESLGKYLTNMRNMFQ